jgi:hypothetical protein
LVPDLTSARASREVRLRAALYGAGPAKPGKRFAGIGRTRVASVFPDSLTPKNRMQCTHLFIDEVRIQQSSLRQNVFLYEVRDLAFNSLQSVRYDFVERLPPRMFRGVSRKNARMQT